MLYLRNTNQLQSVGREIKRGSTNSCCTPTLNSVTTASLTELTINSTFGTYLVNCKSCVGGYIQVTENSGSTWTTINPGNCSTTNLVPQPSQSAYYRVFTSCSSNNQPFDPLTSSFSNEIQFIPYGIINYKFTEEGGAANGVFKLFDDNVELVNATSSVSGTFWEILSASMATASLYATEFPLTGSTSMSLIVTGSNVSYATSSCLQSGSIFLDAWKVIPHQFYDVTASINHRPENNCTASSYESMGYLVNSYDETNKIWYHTNEYGVAGPGISGSVNGTATKTNVLTGDCRYNAIQFSGSITLNIGSGSFTSVYMAIETGSFTVNGNAEAGAGLQYAWSMNVGYQTTGSISLFNYNAPTPATTKNSLIGFELGNFIAPFNNREVYLYTSGSQLAVNPPFTVSNFPANLGYTLTLSGVGRIRAFGYGTYGTAAQQAQYNCIYETTPSK